MSDDTETELTWDIIPEGTVVLGSMAARLCESDTVLAVRIMPGHMAMFVIRMMFTYRLAYGPAGAPWYEDGWCYHDLQLCLQQFAFWPGPPNEPEGWHRHPSTGRRRPDGDPSKEYVAL